jgi:hypothetical protein
MKCELLARCLLMHLIEEFVPGSSCPLNANALAVGQLAGTPLFKLKTIVASTTALSSLSFAIYLCQTLRILCQLICS